MSMKSTCAISNRSFGLSSSVTQRDFTGSAQSSLAYSFYRDRSDEQNTGDTKLQIRRTPGRDEEFLILPSSQANLRSV